MLSCCHNWSRRKTNYIVLCKLMWTLYAHLYLLQHSSIQNVSTFCFDYLRDAFWHRVRQFFTWLSSENNILLQSSTVHFRYFRHHVSLFFFIPLVSNCFCSGLLAFRPPSRSRRRRTVDEAMWTPTSSNSFFRSSLVFLGCSLLFRNTIASSRFVVFDRPHLPFLIGYIEPVSRFWWMILFTAPKLTSRSAAIVLWDIDVFSLNVTILLRFLGVMSMFAQ